MQKKDDIFSKIVASKTIIIGAFMALFVVYAVVGIIMLFSSKDNLLSSVAKIIAPLSVIGFGLVIAVDSIHKMTSDKSIVKIFGLITLLLGVVDLIVFILIMWEIIPMYERNIASFGYYSSSPTIAFKLVSLMTSIVSFTFLGSIVMNIKENHSLMNVLKKVSTGFLACASLISIVCNFVDFSQDTYGSVRAGMFQAISWITAISLGAVAFYLSKTITWEEKTGSDENESKLVSLSSASSASELSSASTTKPFADVAPVTIESEDDALSATMPPQAQSTPTFDRQSIYPKPRDLQKQNKPEVTDTQTNTPASQ